MPPEEDEREGDFTPFSSLELQLDDSHKLPPGHLVVMVLVRGLKEQEDYVGVLDVILLPSGGPLAWITWKRKTLLALPFFLIYSSTGSQLLQRL